MSNKPLTYARYLQIDLLLSLQKPLSNPAEHDETLFIVIHQVYELWFKQLLHEVGYLRERLTAGDGSRSAATLKRILTIFKTLVTQIDVLETMTPISFNAFRTRLESSSGFQSVQFRALEFALGHRRPGVLDAYPKGGADRERLAAETLAPSVYDAFLRYLSEAGFDMPDSAWRSDFRSATTANQAVQDVLLEVYRQDGEAAQICERLVDLDEALQEWRYRHVKMVERTIGIKPGTGGSAGVGYLQSTLFKSLFPDLWAIRSRL